MKNLKDLTKEEYKKLDKIGMLYVLYPEANGDYELDTRKYIIEVDDSSISNKIEVGDYIEYTFTRDIDLAFLLNEPLDETRIGRINRIINNSYIIDDKLQISSSHIIRKLKPSQIESHLREEAKKRGYKKGTKIYRANCGRESFEIKYHTDFIYDERNDSLYCNFTIYKQGQWAEIIKDEPIKIGGYEVKFKKGKVSVGCIEVSNDYVRAINLVSEYCMLKSQELQFIANSGELIFFQGVNDNYKIDRNTFAKIIEKLED